MSYDNALYKSILHYITLQRYTVTNPRSTYDVTKVDVHPIITVNKVTVVCLTILQFNQLTTKTVIIS